MTRVAAGAGARPTKKTPGRHVGTARAPAAGEAGGSGDGDQAFARFSAAKSQLSSLSMIAAA